jgi:hypothetical protein
MNLVARFENFIERLMERSFTRAAHGKLQPVEIGKRLVRAMESQQQVGVGGILVPNVYDVYLSRVDYAHFQPARRSIATDLGTHLSRVARQRRFQLVSKPVVRLHEDEHLSPGDIRVEPHLQDLEQYTTGEFQHTALLPQVEPDEPAPLLPAVPSLVLDGQTYAILRSPTRVGRLPDNDIVLDDKRVSRYHAELSEKSGGWMLRDTGSTNGTAVNGKIVKEAVLKPGDRISLGGLEVLWEQGAPRFRDG